MRRSYSQQRSSDSLCDQKSVRLAGLAAPPSTPRDYGFQRNPSERAMGSLGKHNESVRSVYARFGAYLCTNLWTN